MSGSGVPWLRKGRLEEEEEEEEEEEKMWEIK